MVLIKNTENPRKFRLKVNFSSVMIFLKRSAFCVKMQGRKLTTSSGHFPPLVIFFWDLITALSYWDMFYPSTCTRGCWKIFTVCAHIRHIWASIWKKKFWKNSKFWQKFLYVPFVRKYFFQIYFPKGAIYERIVVPNILSPYQT